MKFLGVQYAVQKVTTMQRPTAETAPVFQK